MYVCVRTYVCMCVLCMYVRMHNVSMYVRMSVWNYICTYIF